MCVIFRKLKHCRKRWCWWWLFKRYRTCLPCSRNLKLLKTVKLDRLFKKEQRKDLHLRVPLPGSRLHARTDPSLRLDSWFNLPGRKHGMPLLALAVLFRFQKASGPGHFHGNQKHAASLPVSWTTRQKRTRLGHLLATLWEFQSGMFPEEMKETAALCWPEGLTVMRGILL